MRKKDSILKRHPIIPSIFFLLFAWVLLYLITGFKDPEKSDKLVDNDNTPELLASGPQEAWSLEINSREIRFRVSDQNYSFPYVAAENLPNTTSKFLKVYKSRNQKSQIQIFVLQRKESKIYDVIVEKDGEYFHTYGK